MLALFLNHNRIKSLPSSIVDLKPNGIILYDNRLCDVPEEIRTWINKYVIAYNGIGKSWMESQRSDDMHNCDGTLGTAEGGSAGGVSQIGIEVTAGRIVLTSYLPFSCALFDLNGARVFQSQSLSTRLELGLSTVKKGIYFGRFESADGARMQKLVIP